MYKINSTVYIVGGPVSVRESGTFRPQTISSPSRFDQRRLPSGYSPLVVPPPLVVLSAKQSLRKFARLYRSGGLENLADCPQFHQTDTVTVWKKTTI